MANEDLIYVSKVRKLSCSVRVGCEGRPAAHLAREHDLTAIPFCWKHRREYRGHTGFFAASLGWNEARRRSWEDLIIRETQGKLLGQREAADGVG